MSTRGFLGLEANDRPFRALAQSIRRKMTEKIRKQNTYIVKI